PTGSLESITYFVFDKSELASRSFDLLKSSQPAAAPTGPLFARFTQHTKSAGSVFLFLPYR
ncbi:MAG: hypothetical protein ACTMK5_18390, partial [Pseudomonas helleri]